MRRRALNPHCAGADQTYGFRPSTEYGITAPDPTWGRFFQVRPPAAYRSTLRGEFVYPQAFDPA
ncbi:MULTISPECIES: hypothetical protein [unclassified Kitasatospora]|uniref:hypothetical protein n=1 Tax=unclassified Kitasatospora TaxID=2633591 RepID=UPI00070BE9B4|nr:MULTISPECIES: hypothetical protein [unclassified Kitasatospora]KQV14590.1 hypothetical protein ASC99_31030 [Kitasatospora sp. Root107]KRB68130.1 hypothetical protein ASE03_29740 [Kitasatospora sp. Root187]